jgi:hypothetical protein
MGEIRYYPRPEPQVVSLGFGDLASVEGQILWKPREWNCGFLSIGLPAETWEVQAEAWSVSGSSVPVFTVPWFMDGGIQLRFKRLGSAGGAPAGKVIWHD